MKNKILRGLLAALFVSVILPIHTHNKDCGYNKETGKGCIYEIELFSGKVSGN